MIDTDACAFDLSASATGRASFNGPGPFTGTWEWDELSLIGQAQGHLRAHFVRPALHHLHPARARCLPEPQTRQTLKRASPGGIPRPDGLLALSRPTAAAGPAGMTALALLVSRIRR